jgi:hypothetical protein
MAMKIGFGVDVMIHPLLFGLVKVTMGMLMW